MVRSILSGNAPKKAQKTCRGHRVEETGDSPVLLCSAPLRPALRRITRGPVPQVPVLSYAEIGAQLALDTTGVVSLADATV